MLTLNNGLAVPPPLRFHTLLMTSRSRVAVSADFCLVAICLDRPGCFSWARTVCHSSTSLDEPAWKGRKAVVVGSSKMTGKSSHAVLGDTSDSEIAGLFADNSAHDICAALHEYNTLRFSAPVSWPAQLELH